MRYTYHVVTPFSRLKNFEPLMVMLRPMGVQWHLLVELTAAPCLRAPEPWIEFHYGLSAPRDWKPYGWLWNWYLTSGLDDDDRYLWFCDDDRYEPGFFEALDALNGELIVCSMQRANDTLWAKPENLRLGHIGGEQVCISGRIAKQCRSGPKYEGDWNYIQDALRLAKPVFLEHPYIRHNGL